MKEKIETDYSFEILDDPFNNIEPKVLEEILSTYSDINKETLFIVPSKSIDVLKIPVITKGICVVLKIKPLSVNKKVKVDYSYLLNFLMIRKDD